MSKKSRNKESIPATEFVSFEKPKTIKQSINDGDLTGFSMALSEFHLCPESEYHKDALIEEINFVHEKAKRELSNDEFGEAENNE
jgi:hypothetical protein